MDAVLAEPLHQAIVNGDSAEVARLLAQGSDCNTLVAGFAALHVSVEHRRFNMVQSLMDHSADPSLPSSLSAETPLLQLSGCDSGRLTSDPSRVQAMRTMLCALGAESASTCVSRASLGGATPLHRIAQRLVEVESGLFSGNSFAEELSLAELLIGSGANTTAKDVFGHSPSDIVMGIRSEEVQIIFGTSRA